MKRIIIIHNSSISGLSGGTITGNINMSSQNITGVNNIELTNINGSAYIGGPSTTTGTITPSLHGTGASGTLGYAKRTCHYYKIASVMYFTCHIELNSKSGMSGDLYVSINTLPGVPKSACTTRYPVTVGFYGGISENKICGINAYLTPQLEIYMLASLFTSATSSFSTASLTQGNINSNFYTTLSGHCFI